MPESHFASRMHRRALKITLANTRLKQGDSRVLHRLFASFKAGDEPVRKVRLVDQWYSAGLELTRWWQARFGCYLLMIGVTWQLSVAVVAQTSGQACEWGRPPSEPSEYVKLWF